MIENTKEQAMLEKPPKIELASFFTALELNKDQDVIKLLNEVNNNYLYWSDIKYKKLPLDITPAQFWACIKISRQSQSLFQWKKYNIRITITNQMQRLCHEFDMHFGGSWGSQSLLPKENREQYLISSIMEEAISSSQMEGAATTRKVAKEMLRKDMPPRTRSEQMISNNYNSICFILEHKNEALTSELLLKLHSMMTRKTLEDPADEGAYRKDDEVVVENSVTHETVHTPPGYKEIPEFIDELCHFFNTKETTAFIHPIVQGIIIHFMVAYVHPFADGNGRTARALFYWYMLKEGYWLTEYLSISRIIYKSKASYEKAFLYTEVDDNDMGYFITYNLRVLDLAFKELKLYIDRKINQRQRATDFLRLGNINERQAQILSIINETPKIILTIKELQNRFAVSYPTAKSDIDELVKQGFLEKIPVNKVKSNFVKGEKFDKLIKKLF